MFYDAHNHWQAKVLSPGRTAWLHALSKAGLRQGICNGTEPGDWDDVARLADCYPDLVRPAYGIHPWKVAQCDKSALRRLRRRLEADPRACVGEIGLDKWVEGHDVRQQRYFLEAQWDLALELDRPMSIHVLQADGEWMSYLSQATLPRRGFHLHSYAGSEEMIHQLEQKGAYFSISGYFLAEQRRRYQATLQAVPLDRLLIETDCPDMPLPEHLRECDPPSGADDTVNAPHHIFTIYRQVAHARDLDPEALISKVSENYERYFGRP